MPQAARHVPSDSARHLATAAHARRPEFVYSLEHGLAVIRSFSRERPLQTLSQVAAATGVTRATARRLLLTLVDLGYVGSTGRQFYLRPAVLSLGSTYLSLRSMWDRAQAHLNALASQVGESCGASVLDGTEAVHVVRSVANELMALNISIGGRLPAYCSASGRALLASLTPAQLDAYLRHADPHPPGVRTPLVPAALCAVLDEVRRQGWALDDQEWRLGVRAIAVPIRDGDEAGALDIVGHASRLSVQQLVDHYLPRLQATAARLMAGA